MTTLSLARISATHMINMNIWGQHSFQVSFPKKIKVTGELTNLINNYRVGLAFKNQDGMHFLNVPAILVNGELRLRSTKSHCFSNYSSEDLELIVCDPTGKILHRQPYTKAVKVKDYGNC